MATAEHEPTIESQQFYRGRILNLRVDKVSLLDGTVTTREIVEHADCVCVVPIDDQDNVVMVRQFRKAVEENLLEVPAGGVEPNEDREAAVQRELEEETGFRADELLHLNSFWTTPGFCTELMHAYVARGLKPGSSSPDFDERIEVQKIPLDRVADMIKSGEIRDAKSIASLLAVLYLGDARSGPQGTAGG